MASVEHDESGLTLAQPFYDQGGRPPAPAEPATVGALVFHATGHDEAREVMDAIVAQLTSDERITMVQTSVRTPDEGAV